MTVHELKFELETNTNIILVDVREHDELNICKIAKSQHIPMSVFASKFSHLPKDKDIIVLCHHGIRSQMAVNFLLQHGYTRVKNIEGGIDSWAKNIDKTMMRY